MPLISFVCLVCDTPFKLERWDVNRRLKLRKERGNEDERLFCSHGCASTYTNVHRYEKRELICANCGQVETVNESHFRKKYCSHPCYIEHQRERLASFARLIGKLYAAQIGATQKESYRTGRRVHGRLGKAHTEMAKKTISLSQSRYYQTHDGPWKGKKMPMSARIKMSVARSRLILSGGFLWKTSKFFSKKNNEEIFCRSTWERRYFLHLENRLDVVAYKTEPFAIPYKHNGRRLYHPDVLITYAGQAQELHEVKPAYYVTYPINKAKFSAARAHCKTLGIPFKIITEHEMRAIA